MCALVINHNSGVIAFLGGSQKGVLPIVPILSVFCFCVHMIDFTIEPRVTFYFNSAAAAKTFLGIDNQQTIDNICIKKKEIVTTCDLLTCGRLDHTKHTTNLWLTAQNVREIWAAFVLSSRAQFYRHRLRMECV